MLFTGRDMKFMQLKTPIGLLGIAADDQAVTEVLFMDGTGKSKQLPNAGWVAVDDVGLGVAQQLNEYFSGERYTFDLPLDPQGTEFQKAVWQALLDIPYGTTCTYQHIAQKIRRPKAMRAVGAANGKNPIPVIIPCHRVIGANGNLTGFGGGIPIKKWLLNTEASLR